MQKQNSRIVKKVLKTLKTMGGGSSLKRVVSNLPNPPPRLPSLPGEGVSPQLSRVPTQGHMTIT